MRQLNRTVLNTNLVEQIKEQMAQDSFSSSEASHFATLAWQSFNTSQKIVVDNLFMKLMGCSLSELIKESPQSDNKLAFLLKAV